MTLTNYWWLLAWMFVAGAFLYMTFPQEKVIMGGKTEERWTWRAAIILALPYIIWAGYRSDYFGDTYAYRKTFLDAPDVIGQIIPYISVHEKDRGFSVIMILFKSFLGNSDTLFFLVIAMIQMLCIVSILKKYSSDYWFSMFLFIASTDYLSWMHNGMRQFLAVTIIFACFGWMIQKKYVPLIAVILLASTIHGSALIMLPIVFMVQGKAFNKKTLLFVAGIVFAIAFIDKFTPFLDRLLADTQYSDMVTNEIWTNDDGTSMLRVLVYSAPALLALLGKSYVDEANDPIINLSVNCSIVTTAIYFLANASSGIYIGRLPIYTTLMGYIAVPWLIRNMFTKKSISIVYIGMIAMFSGFFYFQMHIGWNVL